MSHSYSHLLESTSTNTFSLELMLFNRRYGGVRCVLVCAVRSLVPPTLPFHRRPVPRRPRLGPTSTESGYPAAAA